jgi:UDPglucose 6-dehydrogenase
MNVSIIGTGYVGLVSGACLAELGNTVTCMDADQGKVTRLRSGKVDLHEPGLTPMVRSNVGAERLRFTSDLREAVLDAAVVLIAVGTPRGADGAADTSEVFGVARDLKPVLRGRDLVLGIKSTVPVGTGRAVQDLYGDGGARGIAVASVPEFLREGSAVRDFLNPDRIVVGTSSELARKTLSELFAPLQAPVVHTTSSAAEMIKLAANSYLAMRVSFVNSIQHLCDTLQVDSADVIRGMGMDRRIGHRYFQPGLGYGGPCLPKDVDAILAMADRGGVDLTLMEAVQRTNAQVLDRFIERVLKAFEGDIRGMRLCALGLSFKAGTGDLRGSRAAEVVRQLSSRGARVTAFDPAVASGDAHGLSATVVSSPYEAAKGARAALLLTAWPEFAKLDFRRMAGVMADPLWIESHRFTDRKALQDAGFRFA